MEITVNEIGPSRKGVKLFVSADNIKKDYQKKISEVNKNVVIPGFRSGKVPQKLIEKRFKKDILSEMKRDYLLKCFEDLTHNHKIRPIEEPDVNFEKIDIDNETEFSYELDMEIFPEIALTEEDYKNLEGNKKAISVADTEISDNLERLRERKGEWVPVEDNSTSTEKDLLVCDMVVKLGEENIYQKDGVEVVLSHPHIEGISLEKEDFLNRALEESFNKNVVLPENFVEKEHVGKEAVLSLKVVEIKRMQLPEMNDEFAKDLGTENLEDLKNKIKEQLAQQKENDANSTLEHDLIHALGEKTQVAMPEQFLAKCIQENIETERKNQERSGKQGDEIQIDEEEVRKNVIHDLKETFIINYIADQQKIEVSKKEINAYINELAYSQAGYWPHEMRKMFERESFRDDVHMRMKNQKVLEFLRENAKITIVENTDDNSSKDNSEAEKSEKKDKGKNKKNKK